MGYFEEQFGMHVQSKTKESQTAVFGDVRISVLTSRLLRVETMNAAKAFCAGRADAYRAHGAGHFPL